MSNPVFLRRSDDGRISIYDERDKFLAAFKNGQWTKGLVFTDYELDEFTIILEESEMTRVLYEARAALKVSS